jgi:hypothetical protein
MKYAIWLLLFLVACSEPVAPPSETEPQPQCLLANGQTSQVEEGNDGYWNVRVAYWRTVEEIEVQPDGTLKVVKKRVCERDYCWGTESVKAETAEEAVRLCRRH